MASKLGHEIMFGFSGLRYVELLFGFILILAKA